ncbi:MAG TPA: MlaD family protein [Casimicrobiaceae bacterium]|nr:MlaD family protein [Casimicrobiaceae bacterium]
MSARANFFKIGLFVIGATVALVILLVLLGAGKLFQSKIVMETYFNESVQGLEVGSKVKYRGVIVGEVKSIGFTYTRYQLDKPMDERLRYVMVEATILPRLIGGRTTAGDLTRPDALKAEIEKGLRVRLAPQGITGTSYLEIDYVDPKNNPLLPISWEPDNLYIPGATSTVTQFVAAASEIVDRLRKLDLDATFVNLNTLLVNANKRIEAVDSGKISDQTKQVLSKLETKLDQLPMDRLGKEGTALLAELRVSNQKLAAILEDPAWKTLPGNTDAALAGARKLVEDPNLPIAIAHLQRTLARLDRLTGGGEADLTATLNNLRQITDNLRDLTETAKQYPSGVLLGAPPPPIKGAQ